jgi:hypothetical protein
MLLKFKMKEKICFFLPKMYILGISLEKYPIFVNIFIHFDNFVKFNVFSSKCPIFYQIPLDFSFLLKNFRDFYQISPNLTEFLPNPNKFLQIFPNLFIFAKFPSNFLNSVYFCKISIKFLSTSSKFSQLL